MEMELDVAFCNSVLACDFTGLEASLFLCYFKKLEEFKKAVGTEYLMMVNEPCLWGKAGQDQMLKVITEIIKAKYERMDRSNIFSSTFLRVLREARGEGPSQVVPYIPF